MKHDDRPGRSLERAAESLGLGGLGVDPEGFARLEGFEALLRERALPLGIVSRTDAERVRERHLLDSLRGLAGVRSGDSDAYDLGSGAGLPGLVVAIARPRLTVHLVEPRRTRVAFLELAVERLGVTNALVVPGRIEDVHHTVDLCFARAFAALPEAWEAALPRLRPGGRLVYFGEPGAAAGALPGASAVEVLGPPVLESFGPLTIMTR